MSPWDYLLSERKPVPRAEPKPLPRPRRRWLLGLLVLLVLFIGIGTYGNVRGRGNVARVQQLRKDLFTTKSATPDQRKAAAQELRTEMRKLSPDQRSQMFAASQKESLNRLDSYFTMSPAQRRQYLDQEIDRMEQRRKEWSNRPPGAGGPGGGPGGGSGRRPGSDRPRSAEETEKRRKEILNHTTPEQRAMMDQLRAKGERFRNDLNQRRSQRGLPPMTGPGVRPGRGP